MGDKPVGSSREHQTLGCIWKNPDMPWTCSGSPSYSSVCNAIRAAVRSDCSRNRYPPRCKLQKHLIVWVNDPCSGWWLFTNPSEKYWCVKLGSYSTILGVKIKMFWNNHLDVSIKWRTLKSNYWGGNFLVGLVNGCSRTLVQSKYLVVGQEECSILFLHCTFPQVQGCMIDTSITYHVNLTSSDH